MRRSPETFLLILNSLVDDPHWTSAARKVGISTMTLTRWIERSAKGDPEFIVEWCDETDQFARHVQRAMRAQIASIESMARKNATGFDEVVTYNGQVQYKLDPKLIGVPDDQLELLYGVTDRYLRINGEVQPLTVRRKASDALVLKMLSAHYPKVYGDKSTVDVNVGGVLRLERPGEKSAPRVIEHEDSDPLVIEREDDTAERAADTNLVALGRPASSSNEFEQWAAAGEFEAEPVVFEDAEGKEVIMGNPAIVRDPENPMRQAMAAELAAHEKRIAERAKVGGPPQAPPIVPVFRPEPSDDPPEIVGAKKAGAPAAPVAPISTNQVDALIDHAIASVQAKLAANVPMSATERQIVNAADRGNRRRVAELVAPRRVLDHVGAGTVASGGAATVTTAQPGGRGVMR